MAINTQKNDSCVEINPQFATKCSIIWLHGLGADGHDFVPIAHELRLPADLGVRFVFPHAPIMPVTINNGYEMRAWFDIHDTSIAAKIDKAGITQSVKALGYLIAQEEKRGIPTNRIILAGFSQGAVIALTTGLTFAKPLAGIMALSGFLPLADEVLQHASVANGSVPIFIAHGTQDNILPFALGKSTADMLVEVGYPVSWHDYAMPHSVCAEEVGDMREWIGGVFSLPSRA